MQRRHDRNPKGSSPPHRHRLLPFLPFGHLTSSLARTIPLPERRQFLILDARPCLRLLRAEAGAGQPNRNEHNANPIRALRQEIESPERHKPKEHRIPRLHQHIKEFRQIIHGPQLLSVDTYIRQATGKSCLSQNGLFCYFFVSATKSHPRLNCCAS